MPGSNRRRFLSYCTDGLLALIGALLAIPVIGYVCAPVWKKVGGETAGMSWENLGPLDALPVGKWQLVTLRRTKGSGFFLDGKSKGHADILT